MPADWYIPGSGTYLAGPWRIRPHLQGGRSVGNGRSRYSCNNRVDENTDHLSRYIRAAPGADFCHGPGSGFGADAPPRDISVSFVLGDKPTSSAAEGQNIAGVGRYSRLISIDKFRIDWICGG